MDGHNAARRPMHDGELEVQKRKGVAEEACDVNEIVVDFISHQWPPFLRQQRFAFVSSVDLSSGNVWASALFGNRGFISVPDEKTIHLAAVPNALDPLYKCIASQENAPLGLLIVDFQSRKRYRANGTVSKFSQAEGITMQINESLPNCPKYIQQRQIVKLNEKANQVSLKNVSTKLEAEHLEFIRQADTFFVGSYAAAGGPDCSHRGGHSGFLRVDASDSNTILWPDYVGNTLMMTLGNIQSNPNVGILIPNFESGNWMQLIGKAKLIWDADAVKMDSSSLSVAVRVERVHILENFSPFIFSFQTYSPYNPELSGFGADMKSRPKEFAEVVEIRNETPLVKTYKFRTRKSRVILPGQFAIFDIELPNNETIERSWTVSSSHTRGDTNSFEITVKRKPNGKVSSWMHDELKVGAKFSLRAIDGDFTPFEKADPRSPLPMVLQPKYSGSAFVLLGAGSGFTPLMSILRAMCAMKYQNKILVHFSVQTRDDLIFAKELSEIQNTYSETAHLQICFTRYGSNDALPKEEKWNSSFGRISRSALEETLKSAKISLSEAVIFLCGPEAYIREIDSHLKEISAGKPCLIFTERFY